MTIPASVAAQAYSAMAKAATGVSQGAQAAQSVSGSQGFGEILQEALQSVAETSTRANDATVAQVSGRADIVDVVTAVTETELAVQTLVSVRDRVISAYQEVMRMPI